MKLIVNKIVGQLGYIGSGHDQIDKKWGHIVDRPMEIVLDGSESNPLSVSMCPNGELFVFDCIGDEQPSSTLYIFRKGWTIVQEEIEIPVLTFKEFNGFFQKVRIQYGKYKSGVPLALKAALYPNEDEPQDL
jgi:hypothetical protein